MAQPTARTGRKEPAARPRKATEETKLQRDEEQEVTAGETGLRLHTVSARVPIPYVTPGDVAGNARAITSLLPPPRRLAFYGGLGVLTVFGALEWPIAAAIGAATEVVSRDRGEREREREVERAPHREEAEATEES